MSHPRAHVVAVPLLLACMALTPARAGAQQSDAPQRQTHEFQVILIRATPGELAMPDVPDDAVKALQDIVQVLRYRHFELIDTAWLRTNDYAHARLGEAGSLEVELALGPAGADTTIALRHFELDLRRFERDPESGDAVFYGDPETLLASSFGITVGEAVVVGTSRSDGDDEALRVLLTAVK